MFGVAWGATMLLPSGVAVVRVETQKGRVVLVSDALTSDQAVAARVLAAVMADDYVMLLVSDVLAAIRAAA